MGRTGLVRPAVWIAAGFVAGIAAAIAVYTFLGGKPSSLLATLAGGEAGVAARVGDREISLASVDARIPGELARAAIERYRARKIVLAEIIDEVLLAEEAEKLGTDATNLRQLAVGAELPEVSESQIEAFYAQHRDQLPPLDETVRDQIREHLVDQEIEARQRSFMVPLREAALVEILLEPPIMPVSTEGAPAKGPEAAPVTLVEFGGFQCPYCQAVQGTLERIVAEYPDAVRLVFRHFPLDTVHPQSRAAAEAAACADEQGGFWRYHDLLFDNQDALGPKELVTYARQAGIDGDAFRQCVDEHRSAERVENDIRDGQSIGVTGTPSFLVNGRPITGLPNYDVIREAIEAELN